MSKDEIKRDDDESAEGPDWDALSVLPMQNQKCHQSKYSANVWLYFGQLMRDNVCVDNRNFYCYICFDDQKLSQYSAANSTTNLYRHLSKKHNVIPERTQYQPPKKAKLEQELDEDITQNDNFDNQHDDQLNELIVVNKPKLNENAANLTNNQSSVKPKKIMVSKDRLKPTAYTPNSPDTTIQKIALGIEESVNTEDYDRLFILSLIKEFRKIPDMRRLEAKVRILNILKEFQEQPKNTTRNKFNQNEIAIDDAY